MKYEIFNYSRFADSARTEQEDTARTGEIADISFTQIVPAFVPDLILIFYCNDSLGRFATVFFV